jgi:hypothetical protein
MTHPGKHRTRPAVVELFVLVWGGRERFLRFALVPLVVAAIYLASLPWSSTIAKFALARSHMRIPYPVWAAMQPIPSMYSFGNRWAVMPEAYALSNPQLPPRRWMNHHPTRVLYEPERRLMHLLDQGCLRYALDARYQSQHLVTQFRVCRTDHDHKIHIEPVP